MKCQQFESVVDDLATEKLMEAGLRNHAMAHAHVCARCATRLADERALTNVLRASAEAELVSAPDRVKAGLLQAFKQRDELIAESAPAITRRSPSRWIAAAAAIAIATLPVLAWLMKAQPLTEWKAGSAVTATATPGSQSPAATKSASGQTAPDVKSSSDTATSEAPVYPKASRNSSRDNKVVAVTRRNARAKSSESVTDFIPLTYLSDATAMRSGTVVRVNISRSTLLALGLPMNVDRSAEMIKADLVVGDDGLARAIRIVY